MAIEARVHPRYLLTWLVIAVFSLVWGAWCIVDAVHRYPQHNRRFSAFAHFQNNKNPPHFDDRGEPVGWSAYAEAADYEDYEDYAQYARAHGWDPTHTPEEPRSHTDVLWQWVQLAIVAPTGLAALLWAGFHVPRRLIADDEGLTGPDGTRAPYEAIEQIDKSRWDAKSIALVRFRDGERLKTIKIDDWVYRGGDRVLEEVERQTGLGGVEA